MSATNQWICQFSVHVTNCVINLLWNGPLPIHTYWESWKHWKQKPLRCSVFLKFRKYWTSQFFVFICIPQILEMCKDHFSEMLRPKWIVQSIWVCGMLALQYMYRTIHSGLNIPENCLCRIPVFPGYQEVLKNNLDYQHFQNTKEFGEHIDFQASN